MSNYCLWSLQVRRYLEVFIGIQKVNFDATINKEKDCLVVIGRTKEIITFVKDIVDIRPRPAKSIS